MINAFLLIQVQVGRSAEVSAGDRTDRPRDLSDVVSGP